MSSMSFSAGGGFSFLPVRLVVLVFGSEVTLATLRLRVFGVKLECAADREVGIMKLCGWVLVSLCDLGFYVSLICKISTRLSNLFRKGENLIFWQHSESW